MTMMTTVILLWETPNHVASGEPSAIIGPLTQAEAESIQTRLTCPSQVRSATTELPRWALA